MLCLVEAMKKHYTFPEWRGVAQPGRALGSGPRGRWFESSHPDFFDHPDKECLQRKNSEPEYEDFGSIGY